MAERWEFESPWGGIEVEYGPPEEEVAPGAKPPGAVTVTPGVIVEEQPTPWGGIIIGAAALAALYFIFK